MFIRQATIEDLDQIAPLFDGYRHFYGRLPDLGAARAFLFGRFKSNQSIIFIAAKESGPALGFTQLYPSFSSVSLAKTLILNDLFVAPEARRGCVLTYLHDSPRG